MKKLALYIVLVAVSILIANGATAESLDLSQANYVNGGNSTWIPETGVFKVTAAGDYWDEGINWKYSFLPDTPYRLMIDGSFRQPVTLQAQKDVDPWTDYGNVKFWGDGVLQVDFVTNSLTTTNSRITFGFGQIADDYVVRSISIEELPITAELLRGMAKNYFAAAAWGSWNPATGQLSVSRAGANYWDINLNWDIALAKNNYLLEVEGNSSPLCKMQIEIKDADDLSKTSYVSEAIDLNGKGSFTFTSSVEDMTARLVFNFGTCPGNNLVKKVSLFKALGEVSPRSISVHESVNLFWDKVSGASSYEVFWKLTGEWVSFGKVDVNTAIVNDLDSGKSYDFKVVALGNLAKSQGAVITASTIPWTGDVNGDLTVDLKDAILSLQTMVRQATASVYRQADVNGDGQIGLAEVIYVMQKTAQLR